MPKQPKISEVFVSYSRHDEALVKPLAAAIGVGREGAVFVDVEQLKAGDLWETKLIDAVRASKVFVLCWCCEAAKSRFVAREIRAALEDETRQIVPVLLCDEKLPFKLRQWQWINLKGKVVHTCRPKASSAPKPSRGRVRKGQGFRTAKLRDADARIIGEEIRVVRVCELARPELLTELIPEWIVRRIPSARAAALAARIERYFESLGQ